MRLLKRIDVWRAESSERAIRYNCVEDLNTGSRYRIVTVDFVGPDNVIDINQARWFVERLGAFAKHDVEQPIWFDTIEAAIEAHDTAFGI